MPNDECTGARESGVCNTRRDRRRASNYISSSVEFNCLLNQVFWRESADSLIAGYYTDVRLM